MKLLKMLFLTLLVGSLWSCEDVVDVELQESEPRLVIEASLLWNIDEENISPQQHIRLTTTAAFFDDNIPAAEGATVEIVREDGEIYNFEEIEPGFYVNNEIIPVPGVEYQLVVEYKNEIYTATASLVESPEIETVEQKNDSGITGDEIEIRVFYTDPADAKNYYLFRFLNQELSLQIYDDEFTNGNRSFAFFTDEDLESGDQIILEIQGISQRFYEYLFILRSQAGTGGGPFQTQPTTVRGNIVNTTNPGNFPFGYFRLSERDVLNYTVE